MVLYNGMAATSPLAALYFVALMTFGNYVLFNLLVAILVEGFQAEVRTPAPGFSVFTQQSGLVSTTLLDVLTVGKSSSDCLVFGPYLMGRTQHGLVAKAGAKWPPAALHFYTLCGFLYDAKMVAVLIGSHLQLLPQSWPTLCSSF